MRFKGRRMRSNTETVPDTPETVESNLNRRLTRQAFSDNHAELNENLLLAQITLRSQPRLTDALMASQANSSDSTEAYARNVAKSVACATKQEHLRVVRCLDHLQLVAKQEEDQLGCKWNFVFARWAQTL